MTGGRGEHGSGSPLRKRLALELNSDIPSPESLQCPLCPYTNTSASQLEEHVNREHLDPFSPSTRVSHSENEDDEALDCPLCVAKFQTSSELETHVNFAHQDVLSPQKVGALLKFHI